MRLYLSGYKLPYCPAAEVYDFKGGSRFSITVPERMKRYIKYHLAFLFKFYPTKYLIPILISIMPIDLAIAIMVTIRHRTLRPLQLFAEIINDLPTIIEKKRKHVSKTQKIGFEEAWRRMKPIGDTVKTLIKKIQMVMAR